MNDHCPWMDITIPVSPDVPVWPGDPVPVLTPLLQIENGDTCRLSTLHMGLHTGTHVDAPLHFIPGGKDVTALDLGRLTGAVQLIDLAGTERITAAVLQPLLHPRVKRVLFRTFHPDEDWNRVAAITPYRALDQTGARFLADAGIVLCGIDGITIACEDQLEPVHRLLLERDVVIVENLNLSALTAGHYEIIVLPLLVPGAEAAPARALIKKSLHGMP